MTVHVDKSSPVLMSCVHSPILCQEYDYFRDAGGAGMEFMEKAMLNVYEKDRQDRHVASPLLLPAHTPDRSVPNTQSRTLGARYQRSDDIYDDSVATISNQLRVMVSEQPRLGL